MEQGPETSPSSLVSEPRLLGRVRSIPCPINSRLPSCLALWIVWPYSLGDMSVPATLDTKRHREEAHAEGHEARDNGQA